jgi:hypothetical protein
VIVDDHGREIAITASVTDRQARRDDMLLFLRSVKVPDLPTPEEFDGAVPPAHFEPHLKLAVTIGEPDANWGAGLHIVDVLDGLRRGVAREINVHIVPLMNVPLLPWD